MQEQMYYTNDERYAIIGNVRRLKPQVGEGHFTQTENKIVDGEVSAIKNNMVLDILSIDNNNVSGPQERIPDIARFSYNQNVPARLVTEIVNHPGNMIQSRFEKRNKPEVAPFQWQMNDSIGSFFGNNQTFTK